MSDNEVYVPYGDDAAETATLLLAAAEKEHEDQTIVRSVEGGFYVPKDVADEAGVDYEDEDDEDDDRSSSEQSEKKAPAKKAAPAKK